MVHENDDQQLLIPLIFHSIYVVGCSVVMVGLTLLASLLNPPQYVYLPGALLRTANWAIPIEILVTVVLQIMAGGPYLNLAMLYDLGVRTVFRIRWLVIDVIYKKPAVGDFLSNIIHNVYVPSQNGSHARIAYSSLSRVVCWKEGRKGGRVKTSSLSHLHSLSSASVAADVYRLRHSKTK